MICVTDSESDCVPYFFFSLHEAKYELDDTESSVL